MPGTLLTCASLVLVRLARIGATSGPGRWLRAGESSAAALIAGSALAVMTNSRTSRMRSRGSSSATGPANRAAPNRLPPVVSAAVRRLMGIAIGMVSIGMEKCS